MSTSLGPPGGRAFLRANVQAVPRRDVDALWNRAEQGARLVFQP